jgi:hypothetical protein
MRTRSIAGVAATLLWIAATGSSSVQGQYSRRPVDKNVPTFSKDVAPIIFKNCAGCHRPGEIAPMSLLTYDEARPWAKAIRDEVGEKHMPPWHADAPPARSTTSASSATPTARR